MGVLYVSRVINDNGEMVMEEILFSSVDNFEGNKDEKKKTKRRTLTTALVAIVICILISVSLVLFLPRVKAINIVEQSLRIEHGDATSLHYNIEMKGSPHYEIDWKSSDERVATIDRSGRLIARGEGTCTIWVEASGKSDSVVVTVFKPTLFEIYKKYCNPDWAKISEDGRRLVLSTSMGSGDKFELWIDVLGALADCIETLGVPDETRSGDTVLVKSRGWNESYVTHPLRVTWIDNDDDIFYLECTMEYVD